MNPDGKIQMIQVSIYIKNEETLLIIEYPKEDNLSLKIINLVINNEEKTNDIKALNVDTLIYPIIFWATEILGSYLLNKLFTLGAQKFCKDFENTNSITKIVCEELKNH